MKNPIKEFIKKRRGEKAGALNSSDRRLYDIINARYQVRVSPAILMLVHMMERPAAGLRRPRVNIRLTRNSISLLMAHMPLKNYTAQISRLRPPEQKSISLKSLLADDNAPRHLVEVLRRAFSGTNLQLRQSLVSLVRDIHNAGRIETYNKSVLLLYSLFLPYRERDRLTLHYPGYNLPPAPAPRFSESRDLERLIEEKLKSVREQPQAAKKTDAEAVFRDFSRRLEKEQRDNWRYEKLQRGLI